MFEGCTSVKILDLTGFEVDALQHISRMFANCENLENVYVSHDLYNENIGDGEEDCFVNVYKLSGKGEDGTICKAGVDGGTTEDGTFAILPSASNPKGYLTSVKYLDEAVILSDSYKGGTLSDEDAITNSTKKGSLNKMLSECEEGYYVRLVGDIDLSNPKFDDDELNNEIDSTKFIGTPSALDIGGHKLTVNKLNLSSATALMDTSEGAIGTIVSPKGNIKAEYNAEGAIPLYASDDYSSGGVSVSMGYHLLDINIKRACFTFNPKTASLSKVDNSKAGFGTYVKILANDETIRKKALLILANEDASIAGLNINFEDLAAVSNDGGVELKNQSNVKRIEFRGFNTDSISYRTLESAEALEGEIARSESLKASVKAYAKGCLKDGSTSSFVSARYYLTSKEDINDKYLTNIKFNINVKSVANDNCVIASFEKEDKTL